MSPMTPRTPTTAPLSLVLARAGRGAGVNVCAQIVTREKNVSPPLTSKKRTGSGTKIIAEKIVQIKRTMPHFCKSGQWTMSVSECFFVFFNGSPERTFQIQLESLSFMVLDQIRIECFAMWPQSECAASYIQPRRYLTLCRGGATDCLGEERLN